MARPQSSPTQKQRRTKIEGCHEGIRLFYALIILLVAAIVATLIANFNILSPAELPDGETRDEVSDPQVHMLYDDLETASQPFDSDGFSLDSLFGKQPHWGTLNSGHYFSLKLSTPRSLETSLIWFKNELSSEGRLSMRHLCDQNDKLDFYSWTHHDFWTFGKQTIRDGGFNLITSYLKDSENPLNWRAKIDLDIDAKKSGGKLLSVIQYVTLNSESDILHLMRKKSRQTVASEGSLFTISGNSADLGDFEFNISIEPGKEYSLIKTSYVVDWFDKNRLPISTYLHSEMIATTQNRTRIFHLPNTSDQNRTPNIIAIQLTFNSSSAILLDFHQATKNSRQDISSYDTELASRIDGFDAKFDKTFKLEQSDGISKKIARVALSNMIGSVGYFYGQSYIGSSMRQERIVPYGPIQLLTAVPSRSFFPRGFLWDEGFHNLLISKWDPELSNKIINSWFNIMNKNGWIPREVILGTDSLRRVPNEFVIQRIANANPPAMLLAIEQILDAKTMPDNLINSLYPKVKHWFNWFNMTQFGPKPGTYRWRGRDELSVSMLNPKTLTSGLDDYPRASHPSKEEYHIDLRCWMALAARTIAKMAYKVNDVDGYSQLSKMADELSDNRLMDELHWSDEYGMYCDFGMNAEKVDLVWVTKKRKTKQDGELESYKVLERHVQAPVKMGCVPEFGYVSLFPMIMKLLKPDNPRLGVILDKLQNKNELWSSHGIRSLSKTSRYFMKHNTQHDKPYWRGPIWINLNYLILSSLDHYSKLEGPYKERCSKMAHELKEGLLMNMVYEFIRTNYLWENYDEKSGRGQGSHPFTGWSSLILLIMSNNNM